MAQELLANSTLGAKVYKVYSLCEGRAFCSQGVQLFEFKIAACTW